MKFTFELPKKKVEVKDRIKNLAKAGAFVLAGFLVSNSAEAQKSGALSSKETPTFVDSPNIKKSTASLRERLIAYDIVPETTTDNDLARLSKSELDALAREYVQKSGSKTIEDLSPGKTYTIVERITLAGVESSDNEVFDFNAWFAEQVKAGNQGKKVRAPDGKEYLIAYGTGAQKTEVYKDVLANSAGSKEKFLYKDKFGAE